MFTAASLFLDATTAAPDLSRAPVDPDVIARLFNLVLRDVLLDAIDADPERLDDAYSVPPSVVAASERIDLSDDGTGAGKREWLMIDYIDYTDGVDSVGEVTIVPVEARNRWPDYAGEVFGFLSGQTRVLVKLSGWSDSFGLEIHGVLAPARVTADSLESSQYDYPSTVESAARWEFAALLASHVGLSGPNVALIEARRAEARERLLVDAQGHVGARVDALPVAWG